LNNQNVQQFWERLCKNAQPHTCVKASSDNKTVVIIIRTKSNCISNIRSAGSR